jgi:hypothetical protein
MKFTADILRDNGIAAPFTIHNRFYTTCPKCSQTRQRAHQKLKCLGVTIGPASVRWGCNHCGWTGGEHYADFGPKRSRGVRGSRHLSGNGRALRNIYR